MPWDRSRSQAALPAQGAVAEFGDERRGRGRRAGRRHPRSASAAAGSRRPAARRRPAAVARRAGQVGRGPERRSRAGAGAPTGCDGSTVRLSAPSLEPTVLACLQAHPAGPRLGRHRRLALRPYVAEPHAPWNRCRRRRRSGRGPAGTRPASPASARGRTGPDLEPPAAERRPGARGRRRRPDQPVDLRRRRGPGAPGRRRPRPWAPATRPRRAAAGPRRVPSSMPSRVATSRPRAGDGEAVEEIAGGVARPDRLGDHAVDRAGVEPLFEQERRRAGDLVAGHQGPLHGRGPAPGGQQREVQVHPAAAAGRPGRRGGSARRTRRPGSSRGRSRAAGPGSRGRAPGAAGAPPGRLRRRPP